MHGLRGLGWRSLCFEMSKEGETGWRERMQLSIEGDWEERKAEVALMLAQAMDCQKFRVMISIYSHHGPHTSLPVFRYLIGAK